MRGIKIGAIHTADGTLEKNYNWLWKYIP